MKTKIVYIRKKLFVALILLVAGIAILYVGLNKKYNYQHLELEKLQQQDIKQGAYVTGRIDSCVGKKISDLNDDTWVTCSQCFMVGDKEYNFYTIPIGDSYIQIMVYDEEMKEIFEHWKTDKKQSVYFEGELIKAPVEMNNQWFEGVDQDIYKNLDHMVGDYVIRQTKIEDNKYTIYAGICLLITAAIIVIYDWKCNKNVIVH